MNQKNPPQADPESSITPEIDEEDHAPMIHRQIPEGQWTVDHKIPQKSVFDVEAKNAARID